MGHFLPEEVLGFGIIVPFLSNMEECLMYLLDGIVIG